MSGNTQKQPEPTKNNEDLLFFLHRHFEIINKFSKAAYDEAKGRGSERIRSSYPILHGIASNIHSIILLTAQNKSNDAYIIARALVERVITFLYLQCCDKDEFDNYIDYSTQKVVRKLDQSIQINDKSYTIKSGYQIDLDLSPKLKESVEKFTSKKSRREITRWSKSSLVTKLEIIDRNSIIRDKDFSILLIAFNSIYDDASEAMHATMYGCTFHYGGILPGQHSATDDECENEALQIMRHLMVLSALLVNITIIYVGNNLGLKDITKNMDEFALKMIDVQTNAVKANKSSNLTGANNAPSS